VPERRIAPAAHPGFAPGNGISPLNGPRQREVANIQQKEIQMHASPQIHMFEEEDALVAADPLTALIAGMPSLVERACRLVEAAALHLGLDAEQARLAGQTATLTTDDKTISILPMGVAESGGVAIVLTVQTQVPVSGGGNAPVAVLQHAPGALHAFNAALGATPEGCWVVHRALRLAPDGAAMLARSLMETVRLADFVVQRTPAQGH
jgi:hypothetical protein